MTKVNEQKPTAEAVRLISKPIDDHWTSIEGIDDLRPALVASVATALAARDAEIERLKAGGCARDQRLTQFCAEAVRLQGENQKQRVLLVEALGLARTLTAKMQSIYDDPRYFAVWSLAHSHMGPYTGPNWETEFEALRTFLSNPAVVELLKESQKGFVNAPTTDDLLPTEAEKAKFAQLHQWQKDSSKTAVELLKPQSVWVPTVQCNGAMACVTIPNRVTTLKFDTEAECQTWCDKRNETDALWVPVEHKELLKGVGE